MMGFHQFVLGKIKAAPLSTMKTLWKVLIDARIMKLLYKVQLWRIKIINGFLQTTK